MNKEHLAYCAGPEWRETVREHVVPGATAGVDLGEHLLEVGPGPGLTTDVLATMVPRMTAVELDADLAASLAERYKDTHVSVHCGDATAMPFPSGTFSSAICLTMLHHLPTPADQDRLFAELNRVVRAGGTVMGSDSLDSPDFRSFHEGDICTPVDPAALEGRLLAAGLADVQIAQNPYSVGFKARATGK
jgi:ubiquinone/menaquinone biosynthesis C-methylase UbiE